MSIDRRILAILYFNNITDVNTIQKYLGTNGDYYEVIIDDKVTKLKFPGKEYTEDTNTFEKVKDKIEDIVEDIVEDVKDFVEDIKDFVENVKEDIIQIVDNIETNTTLEYPKEENNLVNDFSHNF